MTHTPLQSAGAPPLIEMLPYSRFLFERQGYVQSYPVLGTDLEGDEALRESRADSEVVVDALPVRLVRVAQAGEFDAAAQRVEELEGARQWRANPGEKGGEELGRRAGEGERRGDTGRPVSRRAAARLERADPRFAPARFLTLAPGLGPVIEPGPGSKCPGRSF